MMLPSSGAGTDKLLSIDAGLPTLVIRFYSGVEEYRVSSPSSFVLFFANSLQLKCLEGLC
jgi:hypothetical protein